MQRLEVSGAVRPIYGSLGVKRLKALGLFFFIVTGGCRQVGGPLFEKIFSDGLACRLAAVFLTKAGTFLAALGLEGLKQAE